MSNTTNWSSGLPWTPSFGECGKRARHRPLPPQQVVRARSVQPGLVRSDDPHVPYFTPVAPMAYPNPDTLPIGTDACSLARPVSDRSPPACGTIGNIGRNVFHGPAGFYSDLSVSKRFLITERFSAAVPHGCIQRIQSPRLCIQREQRSSDLYRLPGRQYNGKITSLEGGSTMRELQFALRFDF